MWDNFGRGFGRQALRFALFGLLWRFLFGRRGFGGFGGYGPGGFGRGWYGRGGYGRRGYGGGWW